MGGWLAALAASLALFAASLFFGELNQDEGWYLYAARLVAQGQRPYVDFASTQGPVLPFVYAAAQPGIGGLGVAGGRLLTAVFGLLAALSAAWLAARLAPRGVGRAAALMGFALVGVNVYQCYFTTIVKTYALGGLLLTLSFVVLTFAGRRAAWALAAGILAALAAGTRISAGAAVPVVLIAFLAPALRRGGSDAEGAAWRRDAVRGGVAFGAGVGATLCALFLPFVLRAPQAVWFALVEYHKGRQTGGLVTLLAYKVAFLSRVANAYSVAFFLLLVCLAAWLVLRRAGTDVPKREALPLGVLWACVAAVTALHFVAPFPYDDYQAMVFPLAAAALAASLTRVGVSFAHRIGAGQEGAGRLMGGVTAVVLAASIVMACSSPTLQGWFIGKRDRVWWPLRAEFPLAKLQRVARQVRTDCGGQPGQALLTQDTYLAVEAGMTVPRGLELGPFSYFPEWSDEKAAACRVLNRTMMKKLLETAEARVAAFSGYGLSIAAPGVVPLSAAAQAELWEAVRSRYRMLAEEPDFGQAETTLQILVLK
jgi:hypothetical protein